MALPVRRLPAEPTPLAMVAALLRPQCHSKAMAAPAQRQLLARAAMGPSMVLISLLLLRQLLEPHLPMGASTIAQGTQPPAAMVPAVLLRPTLQPPVLEGPPQDRVHKDRLPRLQQGGMEGAQDTVHRSQAMALVPRPPTLLPRPRPATHSQPRLDTMQGLRAR